MTVEERLDQLEKRNKRLTAALTLMAVAICAVVTIAATDDKVSEFDVVSARYIAVRNDAGLTVVTLGANDGGDGLVNTYSAKNNNLVKLSSTLNGGSIKTYQSNGKELGNLTSTDNGGFIGVINKTGESIAQMRADEYGNGVVYAGNRKGKGRTLKPGP